MKNQITNKIKDSCIIYRSFIDATISLPDAERLQIFDAIFSYALDGKESNLSGISYTVFTLIKPQLDANRKRFENGCKEKKKSKTQAKGKQKVSKPEANDNVNDNVNLNQNLNQNLNLKSELEILNVPEETWNDFVKMRKQIKKPLTEAAIKLSLKDLKNYESKQSGFARLSLENSIKNSWQGLFEPKSEKTITNANNLCEKALILNNIANDTLFRKISFNGEKKAVILAIDAKTFTKAINLPDELREKIKAKAKELTGAVEVELKH